MDWRSLLRNRWVWLAGAGAAGLGVVAYLRNRGKPAGAADAGSDNPAYASGAVGSFDSYGTDVASWLGHYSEALDRQFAEFKTDVLGQLAQLPNEGPIGLPSQGPYGGRSVPRRPGEGPAYEGPYGGINPRLPGGGRRYTPRLPTGRPSQVVYPLSFGG